MGSGARYLVSGWVAGASASPFPFGTLAVNLGGSFLIGFVMALGLSSDLLSPTARLTLTTGVLGGFTTYSTFNYETLALIRRGSWMLASLNLGATVVLCLLAGGAGLVLGRWLVQ